MYAARALLTDKMDPKYIVPLEAYESHDNAHPKKNVGHLGFLKKMVKKLFFQKFLSSQKTS